MAGILRSTISSRARNEGDIGCRHVLADVAGILGRAIAGACNIVDPEVIAVAGDFLPAGELFVQPLREAISRHTLIRLDGSEMGPTTELLMVSFGDDASALGAVGVALHQIGN
ncbi:ROK family protein [Mesorhizobium captivum]|uniref:ROK family protein n=1 Tax=Mesorhizobium captivum TaxID=3072319 RepID=UPI003D317E4D